MWSVVHDIKCSLSNENVIAHTEWVLLLSPAISYIFFTFQSLMYLSAPPVANVSPDGLKAKQEHESVCATILSWTSVGKVLISVVVYL